MENSVKRHHSDASRHDPQVHIVEKIEHNVSLDSENIASKDFSRSEAPSRTYCLPSLDRTEHLSTGRRLIDAN
jgi:hypothetical protein